MVGCQKYYPKYQGPHYHGDLEGDLNFDNLLLILRCNPHAVIVTIRDK